MYKALIVDDNKIARVMLSEMLRKIDSIELVGEFEDAAKFGLLAVLFVGSQLFFRQPKEPRVQRLLFGRDVATVILPPIGFDHLTAERRQLVS